MIYMQYRVLVVNIKYDKNAVYIGRPSALQNPYGLPGQSSKYSLIPTSSRDECCDKFDSYLCEKIKENDPIVIKELCRIHKLGKTYGAVKLGCFCKPSFRCHGDGIKKFIEDNYELLEELSQEYGL